MILTAYSVFSAMLWFSAFAVILIFLGRKDIFVLKFGLVPLTSLLVTTVLRLLLPLEFPFTKVVGSTTVLRVFFDLTQEQVFKWGSWDILVQEIALFAWAVGAAIKIADFVGVNRRARKRIEVYPDAVSPAVDLFLNRVHTPKGMRIVRSPEMGSPYVSGFIKPIIVLTDMEFSDEDLYLVLLHELQHYLNRDQWIKALYKMVRCLLWWNPIVHKFEGQLDQILEMRCDSCILSKLPEGKNNEYCSMLLKATRQKSALKEDNDKEQGSKPLCLPSLIELDKEFKTKRKGKEGTEEHKASNAVQRLLFVMNYDEIIKYNKALKGFFCVIVAIAFLASYMVVFQPRDYGPTQEGGYTFVTEFPEDVYLVELENGKYGMYINDEYTGTVKDITAEPFCSFPIRK